MPLPHPSLHLVAALSDAGALAAARRRFPASTALRIRSGSAEELERVDDALAAADRAPIVVALDADVAAEHVALQLEQLLRGPQRLTVWSALRLDELVAQLEGRGTAPSEMLVDRLEAADVVLLADARLARTPSGARALALARRLAPTARFGDEPVRIGPRGRPTPAWAQIASSGRRTGIDADGLGHVHLSDPRPFHPGRLMTALTERMAPERVGRVACVRGVARVATRPGSLVEFSGLGDALHLGLLRADDDSPSGHELVVFGWELRPAELEDALLEAVLSPEELLGGPALWTELVDRLPLEARSGR